MDDLQQLMNSLRQGGGQSGGGPAGVDDALQDNAETITISSLALLKVS